MESHLTAQSKTLVLLARAFAVLDAVLVAFYLPMLLSYVTGSQTWTPVSAPIFLTYLAIAASARLWWRQLPGRFPITYLLFPIRIAFGALSFTWLATIVLAGFPSMKLDAGTVWSVTMGLEVARLLATIWLHRVDRHASQGRRASATTSGNTTKPHSRPSVSSM